MAAVPPQLDGSFASTRGWQTRVLLKPVNLTLTTTNTNPVWGRRRRVICQSSQGDRAKEPRQPTLDVVRLLSDAGRAVWGTGLPPGALVQVARESWNAAWRVMMTQLAPSSTSGAYQRPPSPFLNVISRNSPDFPPEPGRYVLYAALACPWAHRALIVHRLKGLGAAVPLCIVQPSDSGLWEFAAQDDPPAGTLPGRSTAGEEGVATAGGGGVLRATRDFANGRRRLKEVYEIGGFAGRATVPMLWDSRSKKVVNNESADIIGMLNSQFNTWADNPGLDLAPAALRSSMDEWDAEIYSNVNNGVYCCGFATTQAAYDVAVSRLFSTLDSLEERLASSRFVCTDDAPTLTDIRLFTTLVRFDVAYHGIFKCSRRKIAEYPNLFAYLRDVYQIPGVAETCDVAGVGRSYFDSLFPLNPGGILPAPPLSSLPASLLKPHGRGDPICFTAPVATRAAVPPL